MITILQILYYELRQGNISIEFVNCCVFYSYNDVIKILFCVTINYLVNITTMAYIALFRRMNYDYVSDLLIQSYEL